MNRTFTDHTPALPGECLRCGTCCKKGGPALHEEDTPLMDSGKLLLKDLFTIRKGEPAYDNVSGGVSPQHTDIIKIKSVNDAAACLFYDDASAGCRIYRHRPIECRILKCWDTRGIRRLYRKNRLTRTDVLGHIAGLWDLVDDHQQKCGYGEVLGFIKAVKASGKKDPELEKKVRFILTYDMEIRSLITQEKKVDPDLLDFLFGRPVLDVISPLGISTRHLDEKIIITLRP